MDSNEMAANPMNRRYSSSNKTSWLKGRIFRPSPDVWLLLKGPSNCTQWRRVNIGNIATAARSLRLPLCLPTHPLRRTRRTKTMAQNASMDDPHRRSLFLARGLPGEVRGRLGSSGPAAGRTLVSHAGVKMDDFQRGVLNWGALVDRLEI